MSLCIKTAWKDKMITFVQALLNYFIILNICIVLSLSEVSQCMSLFDLLSSI